VIVVTGIYPVVYFRTPDRLGMRKLAYFFILGFACFSTPVLAISHFQFHAEKMVHNQVELSNLVLKADAKSHWQIKASATAKASTPEKLQATTKIQTSLSTQNSQFNSLRLDLNELSFEFYEQNSAQAYFAENMSAQVKTRLSFFDNQFSLSHLNVNISDGQLLSPYVYADFNQLPVNFKNGELFFDGQNLSVKQINFDDGQLQLAFKELLTDSQGLKQLVLEFDKMPLQHLLKTYISNAASVPSSLAYFDIDGAVKGKLLIKQHNLQQLAMDLDNISLSQSDNQQRMLIEIYGLDGQLVFDRNQIQSSQLSFEQANLLETIPLSRTKANFAGSAKGFYLTEPLGVPVFDGKLGISKLDIDLSTEQPKVVFNGALFPVSLELVTQALGWPVMQGQISGLIPSVVYQNGALQMDADGVLQVRAFDGELRLSDLQASHLLSAYPILQTDVELHGIDLEKLTSTFSFGKITGLLNGEIKKLLLYNWKPAAFKADFKTDIDSPSRRISQRAVDNISNLGGVGMAGALSRTFMRFFEDFGYEQLGLSCELKKGVCKMDGVAPAENGYYLVKGRGLPRIDVIAYNRETDWDQIVSKLADISKGSGPVVQ